MSSPHLRCVLRDGHEGACRTWSVYSPSPPLQDVAREGDARCTGIGTHDLRYLTAPQRVPLSRTRQAGYAYGG